MNMVRSAFLIVDLQNFLFRFRVGGGGAKKEEQKKLISENDQLTGHFRRFFNIARTNSKTGEVNQQSVLNL